MIKMLPSVVLAIAVAVLGKASAHADELPRASGLVAGLAVEGFHLDTRTPGDDTLSGAGLGLSLGGAIGERIVVGGQLYLARPADDVGYDHWVNYLNGFVTVRSGPVRMTGELVGARMDIAHRGEYTGLGLGAQLGYEVAGGTPSRVATNLHVGVRYMTMIADEGSYETDGGGVAVALGAGVTWY